MTKNYKKLEVVTNYWIPENEGDFLEGKVITKGIIIETMYGDLECIELETEFEEVFRVSVTAGLQNVITQISVGDSIMIKYLGKVYNQKTKRRFKSFEVLKAE